MLAFNENLPIQGKTIECIYQYIDIDEYDRLVYTHIIFSDGTALIEPRYPNIKSEIVLVKEIPKNYPDLRNLKQVRLPIKEQIVQNAYAFDDGLGYHLIIFIIFETKVVFEFLAWGEENGRHWDMLSLHEWESLILESLVVDDLKIVKDDYKNKHYHVKTSDGTEFITKLHENRKKDMIFSAEIIKEEIIEIDPIKKIKNLLDMLFYDYKKEYEAEGILQEKIIISNIG